jgi:hypothetical protein
VFADADLSNSPCNERCVHSRKGINLVREVDSERNDLINFSALEKAVKRRTSNYCASDAQHLIALAAGASSASASDVRGRLTFTTSALLSPSLDGVAGELKAASTFS